VVVGIGEQRQVARSLDSRRELSLIIRLRSRYPTGHNLPCFGNVIFQCHEILVIDLLDTLCRKAAKLSTAKKSGHGLVPLLEFLEGRYQPDAFSGAISTFISAGSSLAVSSDTTS
jgi:hypothetical protein